MKKLVLYGLLIQCMFFLSTPIHSQVLSDTLKAKDLVELSFADLMNIQIETGTLTGIERSKTPAILTIITKEEIENTPARNLLDLLEVYVPGGSFVNHWLGPRIGIRGIMSDQNTSYLLIVNGETMNLQYEDGAIFEIQNKDLSDIEKIEIISGPGSVTYGPGAIGGVISITTIEEEVTDKVKIGIENDFTYRYSIINGKYSIKKKNFSVSLFGSVGTSDGLINPEFYYIDRANGYGYGYMSETWGNKGLGTPAPHFYADFQDRPEIKAQLSIKFFKEFEFWARYTNYSFINQQQQTNSLEGPAFPGHYGQQTTTTLKNTHEFSDKVLLISNIGFQSISSRDIALYQGSKKPFNDITQIKNSFSENNINIRSLLSYKPSSKLKLALGVEYKYWYYGPEWGDKKNSFVMDFAPPVRFAVLDTNSGFYSQYNQYDIVTVVDPPINANQFSTFFECNYMPVKNTTILISGRLDKHNMAKLAFSPRISIIQQINKNNYLKLIAQQSVRLPSFRELYSINYALEPSPSPEKLKGAELIFSSIIWENFSLNLSTFYQSINQIGWTDNDKSEILGEFNTAGLVAVISYKLNNLNLTLNYSFIKQLNWDPEYELNSYLSNIGPDSIDVTLVDAGNNRTNNFPQNQIKLIASYKIGSSIYLHFNSRFASSYGQLDMLDMFKSAHDNYGTAQTKQEMTDIYNDVLSKGYSKPSFTSNLSVSYNFKIKKVDLVISSWVMNLFSVNHIRYVYQYWEDGNNRQYPRQVGFVEEPRTFGLRLTAEF